MRWHLFSKQRQKQPRNYTGISLLNTCYKIFSKMLNAKFWKFFNGIPMWTLTLQKGREFNLQTLFFFIFGIWENNERTQDRMCYNTHANRQKWTDHVNRMDIRWIPKHNLQYVPQGRRSRGYPAKRWLESVTDHMA